MSKTVLSMDKREARLAEKIRQMLLSFGVKEGNIFTGHVQERFLNENSFYPIVNKVLLKLEDGTGLVIQSRGIIRADGKLSSRLHFDLIKPKPKAKLEPNFSCKCGHKECRVEPSLVPQYSLPFMSFRLKPRVNVPLLLNRARNRSV